MANVRLARGLFVRANYNYIYQTDDAPESSTQYIFPSPHTATFQADYGFMIRKCYIGLNAAVRYVGAKDYEDFMPVLDMTGSSMASMKYWTGNLYGASRRICGLRRRRQCYVPAAGYAVGRREQYVQPPAVDRQFQFRYHVAPEHVRADQLRVRTRLIVPRPCGVSGENRAIFGGGAVRHFFAWD